MKKPEEIKKGLETCVSEDGSCDDCPYAMEFRKDLYVCYSTKRAVMADALAYIQQLESQVPRWVPVEERMPETDDDVLTLTNHGISMGYYDIYFDEWVDYVCSDASCVTHWMPLPEPPKEDAHE